MPIYKQLAVRYYEGLPERVRQYLKNDRGISDAVIDKHQLGWDGKRIAIPVRDRRGSIALFRLAKAPGDTRNGPKMKATFGSHCELYGWERALAPLPQVIVCEGEFDRLVLESRGYAAVTSTAGALTFRPEWADALRHIPSIFVCFDRDGTGEAGARLVASMLPEAKIVTLPPEVGLAGDVTDYFVGLGKTIEDFDALLAEAVPLPEHERRSFNAGPTRKPALYAQSEGTALKSEVRIEDWISATLTLTVQGENYVARCPFHDDDTPSFVVYTGSQTFHCFGCRAHGDVFAFIMKTRGINFAAACDVVRRVVYDAGDGETAA